MRPLCWPELGRPLPEPPSGIDDCADIVRGYGVVWDEEMVVPVPRTEVWSRMLRNLLNCSKRKGDVVNTALLQQLLPTDDGGAGPPLPYPEDAHLFHLVAADPAHAQQLLQQMLASVLTVGHPEGVP